MAQRDAVDQFGDRTADRLPVRRRIVAGEHQRLAQRREARRLFQLRQAGPAQQSAQCGIAERGSVELGQMRVAAAGLAQDGIADLVE